MNEDEMRARLAEALPVPGVSILVQEQQLRHLLPTVRGLIADELRNVEVVAGPYMPDHVLRDFHARLAALAADSSDRWHEAGDCGEQGCNGGAYGNGLPS